MFFLLYSCICVYAALCYLLPYVCVFILCEMWLTVSLHEMFLSLTLLLLVNWGFSM